MTINTKDFLKELSFLPKTPESICVALSGGADSVCLLHIIKSAFEDTNTTVSAVHINHNLRGEESKADQEFCENLCKKLSVPLTVKNVFVNEKIKKGESVEVAARRIRYEIFESLDCQYVATAHNANDVLETFIINFSRGSGLKGLTGIPKIRGNIIRPLLNYSREDILKYNEVNNLDYVVDSTNLTEIYTRNKVRHRIIPELKKINSEIVEVSKRNLEVLKIDEDFLAKESKKLLDEVYVADKGLKKDILNISHKALAVRVISEYTRIITGRMPDNYHLNLMLNMCNSKNGFENLFNGYSAVINKEYLSIKKEDAVSFKVETEVISKEKYDNLLKVNNLLVKNAIDYDKIVGEMIFRTRTPKDKIRPFGRGLSKSVRKLQNELGVDEKIRDIAPLACDATSLLWGYEIGIDDHVSIDQTTKKVLIFKVYISKNGGQ